MGESYNNRDLTSRLKFFSELPAVLFTTNVVISITGFCTVSMLDPEIVKWTPPLSKKHSNLSQSRNFSSRQFNTIQSHLGSKPSLD